MALNSAFPAFVRSALVQPSPVIYGYSVLVPYRPLRRRRRLTGALTMAMASREAPFVVLAASSPSPPPPSQVDEMEAETGGNASEWGKVSAVLFDMDGVLCNSEELSRLAAVEVFAEMGVSVTTDDFVPFMGTGEANFLGGVALMKRVDGFDPVSAKNRFFEIYLDKYAKPNSGIGFPGALEIIMECKKKGLKVAVASSADRIKVEANLAAADLPTSLFDAIISADAFENLKPAPDIFLAASKSLNVPSVEDKGKAYVLLPSRCKGKMLGRLCCFWSMDVRSNNRKAQWGSGVAIQGNTYEKGLGLGLGLITSTPKEMACKSLPTALS